MMLPPIEQALNALGANNQPDWKRLGLIDPCKWLRVGVQDSHAPWLKRAFAWLQSRQDGVRRSPEAEGPPPNWAPVLLVRGNGASGALGFISIDWSANSSQPKHVAAMQAAYGAASAVGEWYRKLTQVDQWPAISLHWKEDTDGKSVGLSAFIAALSSILKLSIPDDVVATGRWRYANNGEFDVVDSKTIAAKIRVAHAWGYKTLLLVKGQPMPMNPPHELTIQYVSKHPGLAALKLISILWPDMAEEHLVKILALFDQAAVRCYPEDRSLEHVIEQTEAFTSHNSNLVRFIVHDIRSRAYLHAGDSANAKKAFMQAEHCKPVNFPEIWIGEYLSNQRPAVLSVIAVNQGHWRLSHPDHKRLLQQINALNIWQVEEAYSILKLRNTYGRLLEFNGRFKKSLSLLKEAWVQRTFLKRSWPNIFAYCRKYKLDKDCNQHRQDNQCLDILISHWEISGRIPDWKDHVLWVETAEPDGRDAHNLYDWAALLRWQGTKTGSLHIKTITAACNAASAECQLPRHVSDRGLHDPVALIAEALLRHPGANGQQRQFAADLLLKSDLFSSGQLFSILALRARILLRRNGFDAPPIRALPPRSQLAKLHKALSSKPADILARCPY